MPSLTGSQPSRPSVPVLAVTGDSGSGKTTLITRLLPELARRGYRVGVIKHMPHMVPLDTPGKDSYRFWEAGAESVALLTPDRTLVQWRGAPENVQDVTDLMPVDLVLAEGFKRSSLPAILMLGDDPELSRQWGEGREVVVAVGAFPPEKDWPLLDRDDVEGVAVLVEGWLLRVRAGG